MAGKIKVARKHSELPHPTHTAVMAVMARESARGAVIVGTTYLDILLRGALEYRMRTDADLLDAMFTNNGPLQDFSVRIKVAYMFKIIGSGAYADLNIMREIRNAFAHSAEGISFQSEDVAARCKRLWYPLNPAITYGTKPRPTRPKAIFVQAVRMLSDGLYGAMREPPDTFIQWGPGRRGAVPTSPKKLKVRPSRGRPAQS